MLAYDKISYFVSDMMLCLNEYGIKEKKGLKEKGNFTLYRGMNLSFIDLIPYTRNINKIISFPSFTSTSLNINRAKNFIIKSQQQRIEKKKFSVIFDFEMKNILFPVGFDIQEISDHPEEEEVLIQPFTFFKIKKIEINLDSFNANISLEVINKDDILEKYIDEKNRLKYNEKKNIVEVPGKSIKLNNFLPDWLDLKDNNYKNDDSQEKEKIIILKDKINIFNHKKRKKQEKIEISKQKKDEIKEMSNNEKNEAKINNFLSQDKNHNNNSKDIKEEKKNNIRNSIDEIESNNKNNEENNSTENKYINENIENKKEERINEKNNIIDNEKNEEKKDENQESQNKEESINLQKKFKNFITFFSQLKIYTFCSNNLYKKMRIFTNDLKKTTRSFTNIQKKYYNYPSPLFTKKIKLYNNLQNFRSKSIYNECIMEYIIKPNEKEIKIFGQEFVKNNEDNLDCKIYINNEENNTNISEFYKINNEKKLFIKLVMKDLVYDMSHMFEGCKSLLSFETTSNWNTLIVTNMKNMFKDCISLKNLDIKTNLKFDFNKNITHMFDGCSSLEYLKGLSNIDISSFKNISYIFRNCSSLKIISGINNWKTSNVEKMVSVFEGCLNLEKLSDIGNWKTDNVKNMNSMFRECASLKTMANISKWNTHNVVDISHMFEGCKLLNDFPNLNHWDVNNVKDMSEIFKDCISFETFPKIEKWKIKDDVKTKKMFGGCKRIKLLVPLKFRY